MKLESSSDYWIKDIALASEGQRMIEIAREDMPALTALVEKYKEFKPFESARISVCVIPTAETGNLIWALKELGAEVRLCSDNVISVDDRIAAAVCSWGVPVFGKRDQTREEFEECIKRATEFKDEKGNILPPTQIIDDGSDMTLLLHKDCPEWLSDILLVTEQTTCGVNFDTNLKRSGRLMVPVVDINTGLKAAFDNRYGPRESFIPSFKSCKEMQMGGKLALVSGYGMVGKGVVEALQMTGCRVVVSEIDAVRATEALMNGIEVVKVDDVIEQADIFVSACSSSPAFSKEQILKAKRGATFCNMGENRQYEAHRLVEDENVKKEFLNPNLARYSKEGWYVDSLCDGYLLNMRSGGNPPRILGITFALHILAHMKVANGWRPRPGNIYRLPEEVETEVALLNYPELKDKLTTLSKDQEIYMCRK